MNQNKKLISHIDLKSQWIDERDELMPIIDRVMSSGKLSYPPPIPHPTPMPCDSWRRFFGYRKKCVPGNCYPLLIAP